MSKGHEDDQQKVPRGRYGVEKRVCADVSRRFDHDGNTRQYDSRHERECVPPDAYWFVARLLHFRLLMTPISLKEKDFILQSTFRQYLFLKLKGLT